MKEMLMLVKLDSSYCNYLRQFDSRVPYNYANKELRPFIGVLFRVNECMYFAPLSSPKSKHLKISSKLDFLKIDNGKLGAINFNNMLPVSKNNITKVNLTIQGTTKDDIKYNNLLKAQLFWLNRNCEKLFGRAKKLYTKYIDGTLNEHIFNRCCNFPLLEEKCKEYNLNRI